MIQQQEFATPWRNYSINEMDRFDLDEQRVIYVTHDRTCVFIARLDPVQAQTIHWANQDEIEDIWEKHRLIALLPVFMNNQSSEGDRWGKHS